MSNLPSQDRMNMHVLDCLYLYSRYGSSAVMKKQEVVSLLDAALLLVPSDTHDGLATRKRIDSDRVGRSLLLLKSVGLAERVKKGSYKITKAGTAYFFANASCGCLAQLVDASSGSAKKVMLKASGEAFNLLIDMAQESAAVVSASERKHVLACRLRLALLVIEGAPGNQFFEEVACKIVESKVKMPCLPTRYQGDGGIDGIGRKNGHDQLYIQAKRFKGTNRVANPPVQQLVGCCEKGQVRKGYFVTTSTFAESAQEVLNTPSNIKIIGIDGHNLVDTMIKGHIGVTKEMTMDCKFFDAALHLKKGH